MVQTPRPRTHATRRAFVARAAGLGALLVGLRGIGPGLEGGPRRAFAASPKLVRADSDKIGVTLTLALDAAPFPAHGATYTDNTVIVFVPHHFRVAEDSKVDTVLHFHGHGTTAAQEIDKHRLRQQFAESLQNAILVVPQGPVNAKDSSGGKLEKPRGLLALLTEVRITLQQPEVAQHLGAAALTAKSRIGNLYISAHSGGYKVTARCLRHGGFEVNEVWLFDALYGEVDDYFDWVIERRDRSIPRERRKLVSYYGKGRTQERNADLMGRFDGVGLAYAHETREGQLSRAEITKARAVFIKTSVDHTRLTYKHNTLRDCMFASSLKRRLKSDWFADKTGPRKLQSRD